MKARTMLAAVSLVAVGVYATAAPVFGSVGGSGSGRVAVAGTCTDGSHARLTLSHDSGKVEAEMELHTTKAGERWRLRFSAEGVSFASVAKTAKPEGGGGTLSVTRYATHHGSDAITVRAINLTTGAICSAHGHI